MRYRVRQQRYKEMLFKLINLNPGTLKYYNADDPTIVLNDQGKHHRKHSKFLLNPENIKAKTKHKGPRFFTLICETLNMDTEGGSQFFLFRNKSILSWTKLLNAKNRSKKPHTLIKFPDMSSMLESRKKIIFQRKKIRAGN